MIINNSEHQRDKYMNANRNLERGEGREAKTLPTEGSDSYQTGAGRNSNCLGPATRWPNRQRFGLLPLVPLSDNIVVQRNQETGRPDAGFFAMNLLPGSQNSQKLSNNLSDSFKVL